MAFGVWRPFLADFWRFAFGVFFLFLARQTPKLYTPNDGNFPNKWGKCSQKNEIFLPAAFQNFKNFRLRRTKKEEILLISFPKITKF